MPDERRIIAVIPARMGSSRFPGKPLAPILGRPMIEYVYRRTAACPSLTSTVVATCDDEIRRAVEGFGGRVVMTSASHQRASDRVAEAVADLGADIVVMVQGDEPLVTPDMVEDAVRPMLSDASIGCVNLVRRITSEADMRNPNTIKVVGDRAGRALYMSREPIPSPHLGGFRGLTAFKQVCVIPFRTETLGLYAKLEPTPLEQAESIDMLRFIEHGHPVHLVETMRDTHAVDVPADVNIVEAALRAESQSLAVADGRGGHR